MRGHALDQDLAVDDVAGAAAPQATSSELEAAVAIDGLRWPTTRGEGLPRHEGAGDEGSRNER